MCLCQTIRELIRHLHRLRRIGHGRDGILLLETLYLALRAAQFFIYLRHAVVDKFLSAHGNLVFIGIGLTVVADSQLTQHIHSPAIVLVRQGQRSNGCEPGCGCNGKARQVFSSHSHWRTYGDKISSAFYPLSLWVECHSDCPQLCVKSGRKRVDAVLERKPFVSAIHTFARKHIDRILLPHFHVNPLHLLQKIEVKGVKMEWVEVNIDGLVVVHYYITQPILEAVLRVKLKVFHNLPQQDT